MYHLIHKLLTRGNHTELDFRSSEVGRERKRSVRNESTSCNDPYMICNGFGLFSVFGGVFFKGEDFLGDLGLIRCCSRAS